MTEFPESWFDCQFPSVEKNPVWIKHPVLPLMACQYGVVLSTKENSEIVGQRKSKDAIRNTLVEFKESQSQLSNYLGKRAKYIKECWDGEILPEKTKLIYWNMNPLDNRPENILLYHKLPKNMQKDYIVRRRQFTINTLKEMFKRQIKMPSDRITTEYWTKMGIPRPFVREWEKAMKQNH